MAAPNSTREALQDLMEHGRKLDGTQYTQADIARAIDVSATLISQWLSNSYTGNNAEVENKISLFLEREDDRKRNPPQEFSFVRTRTAKQVFEICRLAHLDNELGVVTGDPGLGKTVAVKQYAKQQKNVVLIEAHLGYTARTLFQELHKKVGYDGNVANINKLVADVIDKLAGSDRLIIIDEAEYLPYKALELIRRVHDKAKIGVVLCGLDRLISNIRGKKGEYAQLYSRVGAYRKLEEPTLEDVKKILETVEITNPTLAEFFYEESNGNTRRISKLFNRSNRIKQINGAKSLNISIIKEAKKSLII